MLPFFPTPYPEELWYSVPCRVWSRKSGNIFTAPKQYVAKTSLIEQRLTALSLPPKRTGKEKASLDHSGGNSRYADGILKRTTFV